MAADRPNDLITLTEARRLLGISPGKMAQLIKDDILRQWSTPLDARKKLVSRRDVESLNSTREAA